MWTAPVPFFEDEDEEAIVGDFVTMSARYPKYSAFDICQHIFKDLRDPEMRANQAALQWSKDLTILERIRQARLNGGFEQSAKLTKEQLQAKILSVTEDDNLTTQEKKIRLEGYMAYAETEGWKVKAVEKKTEDRTRRFPQLIQGIYPDA